MPGASRDGTRGRDPTDTSAIVEGISSRSHTADMDRLAIASQTSSVGRATDAGARMGTMPTAPAPTVVDRPDVEETIAADTPWIVLVWNDPINLMSYVTVVFQKLFGYSLQKATELMLDVHEKGRAVVSNGTREKAELDVFRLHEHGLWATMQRDDQ